MRTELVTRALLAAEDWQVTLASCQRAADRQAAGEEMLAQVWLDREWAVREGLLLDLGGGRVDVAITARGVELWTLAGDLVRRHLETLTIVLAQIQADRGTS